jgi:hypothetical protein
MADERRLGGTSITPDDKDWTWVLERPCPECGFDAPAVAPTDVARLVRENAAAWPPLLAHPQARVRPTPDRWSALEYGCHVRDVFRLYDQRLHLMLDHDDPLFPNWDQDAAAVADRYNEQDPAAVTAELVDAAERLAASFDAVQPDQWGRTGGRSDGARFTVASFSRYFIHDPVHHVHDAHQGLAALTS